MRTLVVIGAFAVGIACGSAGAYVCESDSECNDGGVVGVCQAGGYCSFPDGDCPSGQRYGQHVAAGLEGQCVPPSDASDGSAGDTMTMSAGASAGTVADGDGSLDDGGSSGGGATTGIVDQDTGTGPVAVDDSGTEGGGESTEGPIELDPDLVLWLTFDDPENPLTDSSLYGRDVSCGVDACPTVAGDDGMDLAALFDGADDMVEVAHDPALETDAGLTVAARVRNDALSLLQIHTVIARPYSIATENAWELFFRDENGDGSNNVVFEIADPMGQIQLIAEPPAGKGEWARIVAVWTPTSVDLYFDGVLADSAVATGMLLDDSPVVVGGDYDNELPTHYFDGAIDDVRVYRRALDEAEIAALP